MQLLTPCSIYPYGPIVRSYQPEWRIKIHFQWIFRLRRHVHCVRVNLNSWSPAISSIGRCDCIRWALPLQRFPCPKKDGIYSQIYLEYRYKKLKRNRTCGRTEHGASIVGGREEMNPRAKYSIRVHGKFAPMSQSLVHPRPVTDIAARIERPRTLETSASPVTTTPQTKGVL